MIYSCHLIQARFSVILNIMYRFISLKKNLIDSSLLNEYVTFVSILPSILGKELVSVCSTHTNFCLICKKVNLTSFLLKYQ